MRWSMNSRWRLPVTGIFRCHWPDRYCVLHGTRDILLPIAAAPRIRRYPAGMTLQEVPDGGQLLFYTHPALVAKVMLAALESVP